MNRFYLIVQHCKWRITATLCALWSVGRSKKIKYYIGGTNNASKIHVQRHKG